MSELQQTTKAPDGVLQSMCLPLDSRALQDNAFLQASSSSPSSSAGGEVSPDSMRSLSSLSGVDVDVDVDVPDGVPDRKTGSGDDDSGIQSPECQADIKDNINDINDNSTSVYLDADQDGWHDDPDNVTTMMTQQRGLSDARRRGSGGSSSTEAPLCSSEDEEGDDDDDEDEEEDSFLSLSSMDVVMKCHSESEEGQTQSLTRRIEEGPVSELHQEALQEVTELHCEEGHVGRPSDDAMSELHQEGLGDLIELSEESQIQSSNRRPDESPVSELHQEAYQELTELRSKEGQICCSTRRLSDDSDSKLHEEAPLELMELHSEEGQIKSSHPDEGPVNKLHQEAVQEVVEPHTEITPSQPPAKVLLIETMPPPLCEGTQTSVPIQDSPNASISSSATSQNSKCSQNPARPLSRSNKTELKRFPRPDLRNVKPKVVSRAASAPRPTNAPAAKPKSSQPAAGSEKHLLPSRGRGVNRRETGSVRTSRSSSSRVRASANVVTTAGAERKTGQPGQSGTEVGSEVRADGEKDPGEGVMEGVREERGSRKDAVERRVMEESRTDSEQSAGTPTSPCVSAGARPVPPAGAQKMRVTESSAAVCGPAPSCKIPLKPAPSKLPIKGVALHTSLSSSSLGSAASETNTTAANKGVAPVMKNEEKSGRPSSSSQGKHATFKLEAGHRNRTNTVLTKVTAAGQKPPAFVGQVTTKNIQNALQRSRAVRSSRPTSAVERTSRAARAPASASGRVQPSGGTGTGSPTEEEEEKDLRLQNERKNLCILQLRKLVAHGNRRLEALALVIQHICNEREEALKQRKEVSLQLKNLREELNASVSCCERLEKEKRDVCVALEAAVVKLQQQHQAELSQLEETLREFYSAEWDKTHQVYQQQADRCRALMQQQVEEVRSKQEALRKKQEESHAQRIEMLKEEYESSHTELRKTHEKDMQEMDNKLKQSEALLNEKIETLTVQNEALNARLSEEEERRKALADKSQKDSRVLYLEQELESVKVVLEMKTSQLHQQDKKLMQMDRLIETNVKLEECLKKLQQENEDYKARMDKHAALSRQLSTEQAMLQQSLQKESKVNKRLSMENEELLWKLHNGDLNSPRHLSPTSPFHSPRNSASFPNAPVLPR